MAVVLGASLARAAADDAAGPGAYSYAGIFSPDPVEGVAATVRLAEAPRVRTGHIAAWVGVGGPGRGPGGADEWIQIGVDGFPGTAGRIYVEVKRGVALTFRELPGALAQGDVRRLAVIESATRRGWWQATVDGRPVGPPAYLPGSTGTWPAQVMAESWSERAKDCNTFSFSFTDVAVRRPGFRALEPLSGARPFVQGRIELSRSATGFRGWNRC